MNAYKISNWILTKNPWLRYGTYDGNVKLNKLLYFSNLMYYTLYNKNLFEEKFERWDNGPVVKEIYTDYRHYNCARIKNNHDISDLDNNTLKILNIINFVYSDKSAKDLSEETHKHSIWIKQVKNGQIDFSEIDEKERNMMKKIYSIYKNFDFENLEYEIINDTKYYYFKNNMQISDDIIDMLENYSTDEKYIFLEMINGELVFS